MYAVLTHDISSRICDVALNIIECLLQLGVVPSMSKKAAKQEDKVKEADLSKEGASQSVGGAHGGVAGSTGAVPSGGSGDGDGGGDGGGGGGGGESGSGSKNDIKNNKGNKVCDLN